MEVRRSDIDEVPRREGDEESQVDPSRSGVGDQPADQEGQTRGQIQKQGLSPFPTTVHQSAEVSELLRDFVCRSGDPCRKSEPDIDQEDAGHAEPAEKIVQAIPDQDQIGQRLLTIRRGAVAMVLMQKLFGREEDREAA